MEDKTMKRHISTKIVAVLIAVITVAVSGTTYLYRYLSSSQEQQTLSVEEELSLQKTVDDIIATGDIRRCNQIDNELYRSICRNNIAFNFASEKLDISLCKYVDNTHASRDACEGFVIQKAVANKDITICNEATISQVRDDCVAQFPTMVALKEGDITMCALESSDAKEEACKNTFLIQGLYRDPSGFSCVDFSDDNYRGDCALMKKIISAVEAMPARRRMVSELNQCADMQTELFQDACLSYIYRNR